MVTLNSDSISRTFSSNEPNKLTACSMRSMLMRCSMLCFLLKNVDAGRSRLTVLSFTDGNGHLFSDLLLTLGGERHDEGVALHSGRKAPLRHAASLPQEGGKIRFEHVFSLRLRVGAGTWCYFQFVGQQRFRLPCDGQGKKAKSVHCV